MTADRPFPLDNPSPIDGMQDFLADNDAEYLQGWQGEDFSKQDDSWDNQSPSLGSMGDPNPLDQNVDAFGTVGGADQPESEDDLGRVEDLDSGATAEGGNIW
jgi:hypothetical protein